MGSSNGGPLSFGSSEEGDIDKNSQVNGESSLQGTLVRLLKACLQKEASDIHLTPGNRPYFRIHGQVSPAEEFSILKAEELEGLADILLGSRDRGPLESNGAIDGAMSASDGTRYRYNVFRCQNQLSIALRKLEDEFRSLSDLGLPENLYELCNLSDGLVILAGPTGSGKSTTLATLLNRINENRQGHIVTIEDPIEYIHKPIRCLINQREIGKDAATFNDALVSAMRQDPDVILVGEIRDLNTIRTAITAAETGHLVLTTVHASDCVGTVERLVSVFPANEQDGIRRQLSLVLKAIINQHLIVADGVQKKIVIGGEPIRRRRTVCSEILRMNSAVAHLIAMGKSAQIYSTMETHRNLGMQTLEQDLARLWTSGTISEASAIALSKSPKILRDRVALLKKPRRSLRLEGR